MFHNENILECNYSDASKKSKIKKSSQHDKDSIKQSSKSKKCSKYKHKNVKHSKLKHVNPVSDYVSHERLTKHVGFFTKGKISDSISRLKKLMPKEVKARAEQDLKQVLKLTNRVKNKYQKKHKRMYENSLGKSHVKNSTDTSYYVYHKTGFASSSWKDKLQKSVGLASVNSVLASVHAPPQKMSPIKSEHLIARKTLLTKIQPCIKEANNSLFSNKSNKEELKRKLLQIKNRCISSSGSEKTLCSNIYESAQSSQKSEVEHSQNTVIDDFQLNPVFTGDCDDHSDITKIFPSVSNFIVHDNITDDDSTYVPNGSYDNDDDSGDINTSYVPSSSLGRESNSVALLPSSPTTSNDSPTWKLQMSPVKFKPECMPTPTIYFRHKMF